MLTTPINSEIKYLKMKNSLSNKIKKALVNPLINISKIHLKKILSPLRNLIKNNTKAKKIIIAKQKIHRKNIYMKDIKIIK
jgi:hypothetical protein